MDCESLHPNLRAICDGTRPDLPLSRINAYRKRLWGLPPFTEETRPIVYVEPAKPATPRLRPTGIGPGSALLRSYAEKGVPHCDACYELACKMDAWGPDGCEERLEEIVSDMLPRARQWLKENRPWVNKLLPAIVGGDIAIAEKIQWDVQASIAQSREWIANGVPPNPPKPKKQRTTVNKSSGGCCGK